MTGGRVVAACLLILLLTLSTLAVAPASAHGFRIDFDGHRNTFDGYLACSFGTPVFRTVGCDSPTWIVGEPAQNDVHEFEISNDPKGEVAIGVRWDATSDNAKTLYVELYNPETEYVYKGATGWSPFILHATRDLFNTTDGGGHEFGVRVYANQGLVQDQAFEVVTQEFWHHEGAIPANYDPFAGPPA